MSVALSPQPLARNPDWWRELEASDPGRQPQRPTLIDAGVMVTFDTLADLAQALAGRLDGRRALLVRSVAGYYGFDTFPAFSVNAEAPAGAAGGPPVATWLCCVAVQETRRDVLEAAIATAQAQQVAA